MLLSLDGVQVHTNIYSTVSEGMWAGSPWDSFTANILEISGRGFLWIHLGLCQLSYVLEANCTKKNLVILQLQIWQSGLIMHLSNPPLRISF